MTDVLVIIPTYNEKENIQLIIEAVFSLSTAFHVLVVDDNSPDGTAEIVQSLQERFNDQGEQLHLLQREGKLGLGTAYVYGFKKALDMGYEYIIEMDADFSHNPSDLPRLYNTCKLDGFDLSIGSRYISGVNVVNWPMNRVIMSYGASAYVRMITGMKIKDSTAGFVCYRRTVLESIDLEDIKFVGYAFQIEMKFLAHSFGFKVKEIPIIFTNRIRGNSKMSISIFREAFLGVINLKFRAIFNNLPRNTSVKSDR